MVEVKGLKLAVILRKEEEGGYSAQCLELPGCISEGGTKKRRWLIFGKLLKAT